MKGKAQTRDLKIVVNVVYIKQKWNLFVSRNSLIGPNFIRGGA